MKRRQQTTRRAGLVVAALTAVIAVGPTNGPADPTVEALRGDCPITQCGLNHNQVLV